MRGFYERFLFSLYLCNTSILNIKRKDKESERERLIWSIYGAATKEGKIGLSLRARATTCAGEKRFMLFSPCVGLIRLPTLIHFCWPYMRLIRQPILIQCLYFSFLFFLFSTYSIHISISHFIYLSSFLLSKI